MSARRSQLRSLQGLLAVDARAVASVAQDPRVHEMIDAFDAPLELTDTFADQDHAAVAAAMHEGLTRLQLGISGLLELERLRRLVRAAGEPPAAVAFAPKTPSLSKLPKRLVLTSVEATSSFVSMMLS